MKVNFNTYSPVFIQMLFSFFDLYKKNKHTKLACLSPILILIHIHFISHCIADKILLRYVEISYCRKKFGLGKYLNIKIVI